MNIIISAKNFTLTPPHKAYTSKKMGSLLKYDSVIRQIRVELDADKKVREGKKFRVEAWIDGSINVKGGAQGATLYSAIDEVMPKLEKQLRRGKDKLLSKKRRGK